MTSVWPKDRNALAAEREHPAYGRIFLRYYVQKVEGLST